ncbi:MAG: DNA-3-methyladenine glycosylase [Candidatus Nomurabacteria bacterium]|nr:DNA-3-methyladenine glycosylase [Candidatus Nomurabacteria bacterium]USN87743.1 MAG: DNA-3-methyladenine glycosylase [Candidatus Nomurabacteria bacterium]
MKKGIKLPKKFFEREADVVAQELLGTILCVRVGNEVVRLPITETEAYMGPHDLASHSSKGRTKRTEVMYGPAGVIYVYLIYGMYHMLNFVTGADGAAVLIRGAGKYDGPGKLTKVLAITKEKSGLSLGEESGLWVEARPTAAPPSHQVTPRIGVSYAKVWADKHLRFVIDSE